MKGHTFKNKDNSKKLDKHVLTSKEQLPALYAHQEGKIHAIHKPYNKMAIHPKPKYKK
jgi:hypothetical protein